MKIQFEPEPPMKRVSGTFVFEWFLSKFLTITPSASLWIFVVKFNQIRSTSQINVSVIAVFGWFRYTIKPSIYVCFHFRFHKSWLRFCCQCKQCKQSHSGQRTIDVASIPDPLELSDFTVSSKCAIKHGIERY